MTAHPGSAILGGGASVMFPIEDAATGVATGVRFLGSVIIRLASRTRSSGCVDS